MKAYTVFCKHHGAYWVTRVEASTREAAMRKALHGYNDHFIKQIELCAIEGTHNFVRAAAITTEPLIVATKGDRAILGEGGPENTAIVDQDVVTDEDDTVWVVIGGTRTRIGTDSVSEYLPA